jgi:hypothetical protein
MVYERRKKLYLVEVFNHTTRLAYDFRAVCTSQKSANVFMNRLLQDGQCLICKSLDCKIRIIESYNEVNVDDEIELALFIMTYCIPANLHNLVKPFRFCLDTYYHEGIVNEFTKK